MIWLKHSFLPLILQRNHDKKISIAKIQVKKVQALDFTSEMRLIPPPPKGDPAAVQNDKMLGF